MGPVVGPGCGFSMYVGHGQCKKHLIDLSTLGVARGYEQLRISVFSKKSNGGSLN